MGRQLSLPASPKFDDTGLHATECSCPRCEAGYRPTTAQRWAARQAQLRAAAARAELEKAAAPTKRDVASARTAERLARLAADTRARIHEDEELRRKAWRPTDEEIARLRAENGLRPPRRRSK